MNNDSDFDAIAAADELGDLPTSDDYTAELERKIAGLEAQLAAKDDEIAAVQRRVANASQKELEQRTRKLLEDFLPVLDNLDRAVAHPDKQGIELVRRELLGTLGKLGVTHAPARGERFDPNRHEAIAVVPVTDPAQNGVVLDVLREGYMIGDIALRPAGVAVGKKS